MQTEVVKLDTERIDSAKIKEAAALVDSGGLVAFPTETVYGVACRARKNSFAKIDSIKGRDPAKFYTLHVGQKSDVEKYVPRIELRTEKLIRNFWPGPLTIVFELENGDIEKQRSNLEREIFRCLYRNSTIGIRCPDNSVAKMLLGQVQNPVVAPSANMSGQEPAVNGEQVQAQLTGKIEMILDAGPCRYKESSTVVKMGKMGLVVLREGVYSKEELKKKSKVQFMFVCTGNTCRSPMAEGIFQKYLAEKLECNVDRLSEMGYKVSSAGVMGLSGAPASVEAIAACAAKGVDLRGHKNRGLTSGLIEDSDFIFVMEQVHQQRIIALNPGAASKCFLLAQGKGISDPIGHSQEFFNSCADMIETAVKQRISELVI